ncbi:MAG: fumarate reductase subunit FrdD [Actinomycetota bacterium]|jgi:fumarate reductase subunit D
MRERPSERGGLSLDEVLADSEREIKPEEKPELYLILPSRELVFWALFSAGGMVAAFLTPINVAILGIAFAAGWLPDDPLSYERVLGLVRHPLTKVYLGVLVVLPLYHWAHRFRFAVHHQLGVHGWKRLVATLCYGTAVAATAVTVWILFQI